MSILMLKVKLSNRYSFWCTLYFLTFFGFMSPFHHSVPLPSLFFRFLLITVRWTRRLCVSSRSAWGLAHRGRGTATTRTVQRSCRITMMPRRPSYLAVSKVMLREFLILCYMGLELVNATLDLFPLFLSLFRHMILWVSKCFLVCYLNSYLGQGSLKNIKYQSICHSVPTHVPWRGDVGIQIYNEDIHSTSKHLNICIFGLLWYFKGPMTCHQVWCD